MSEAIRKSYSGFLSPHLPRVRKLLAEGKSVKTVARTLRAEGIRGPHGGLTGAIDCAIRHALRMTARYRA